MICSGLKVYNHIHQALGQWLPVGVCQSQALGKTKRLEGDRNFLLPSSTAARATHGALETPTAQVAAGPTSWLETNLEGTLDNSGAPAIASQVTEVD